MTHPDSLRWKATLDTLDSIAEGRNISISNPPCSDYDIYDIERRFISRDFYTIHINSELYKLNLQLEYSKDISRKKQIQEEIDRLKKSLEDYPHPLLPLTKKT